MGTKIHCKSYLPNYCSMRDLTGDSCSGGWSKFYGDMAITNGQYCNGLMPRTMVDGYLGFDKDALKQKILEHEAVFKNQVYELHRLYRIQQDMMEEVRRKEQPCKLRESAEPSSSSNLRGSHVQSQDAQKWHMASLPSLNSGQERTETSVIEIGNSPSSSTKENGPQPGWFPFPNGSAPKDSEASDSRPLKARKILFDLHLPAEVYMDTEEGDMLPEMKVFNTSSSAPNGSVKTGLGSNVNASLVCGTGLETDSRAAVAGSASQFRSSTGLADLNEPVEIEEAIAPPSVDLLGHANNGETKGVNQLTNLDAGYGFLERSESSKSNLTSITHGLRQDKMPEPSHSVQPLITQGDHPSGMYSMGYGRADPLRDREQICDPVNNGHAVSLVASQTAGSFPFFSSMNNSWAHTVSSWEKRNFSFAPRILTMESTLNPVASVNRALQNACPSHEPSGGNLRAGDYAGLNPGSGGKQMTSNGCHHGSALGSKEQQVHMASNCMTSRGFWHLPNGSSRADPNRALDINLNETVLKGSLDEAVIEQNSTLINEKARPGDCLIPLPWFNCKPSRADVDVGDSSSVHASSDEFCCKNKEVRDLNRPYMPKNEGSSNDCEVARAKETVETQSVKKLLGVPIFEINAVKRETLAHVSTSTSNDCCPEGNHAGGDRKIGMIDINLKYEPEEVILEEPIVANGKQVNDASVREYIDLNCCVSDMEDNLDVRDNLASSHESKIASVKATLDIDLEAPVLLGDDDIDNATLHEHTLDRALLQSSENEIVDLQDEVLRTTAEALVAISSSCPQIPKEDCAFDKTEASLSDLLLWFANALFFHENEIERTSHNRLPVRVGLAKMDEFEAATLQLSEMQENDHMPEPIVPEVHHTGTIALGTMSRRVQSRRGRQRRDFQRDILPGLISLSRHEVTEDLQTFAGLMRATGHHWNSGLMRRTGTRNGAGRGRRRSVAETVPNMAQATACTPLVQQLNSIEACLEDRSLTGWGKTPRRPRRQRCHSSNPSPAVVST